MTQKHCNVPYVIFDHISLTTYKDHNWVVNRNLINIVAIKILYYQISSLAAFRCKLVCLFCACWRENNIKYIELECYSLAILIQQGLLVCKCKRKELSIKWERKVCGQLRKTFYSKQCCRLGEWASEVCLRRHHVRVYRRCSGMFILSHGNVYAIANIHTPPSRTAHVRTW